MQSHHCHCRDCRARDDRQFADVVARSYSARSLARLVKLAAPMDTTAPAAPVAPAAESVRPAIRAMLITLERAEECARAAGDNALADSVYALACALAHAEDRRNGNGDDSQ